MKNNQTMLLIIVGLITGGLGFFGGMKYQQTQVQGTGLNRQAQGGRNGNTGNTTGQGRFANGNRPVSGEILNTDDKSITVKLQDGSSKIVILSASTAYNKSAQGAKSDLKEGDRVLATGTDNSDGSITATNIQINPTFGGGMMGGGRNGQNPTGNPSGNPISGTSK